MVAGSGASLKSAVLIFLFSGITPAQNLGSDGNIPADAQKSLIEKKEELSKIKEEISSLEHEIKAKSKKEKKAGTVLETYSRQSFLINKLINKLKKEEEKKQNHLSELQADINLLKGEIKFIRDNYSKYVVAVYKTGKNSELADIFGSNSVQQAVLRYKYLKEFSERRSKNLEDLKLKKDKLESEKKRLNKEVREKELITEQKQNEKKALEEKLKERKKILNSVKRDKRLLADELKLKKKSEARIRDVINKLVEESFNKEETGESPLVPGRKNSYEKNLPGQNVNLSSFENLKGKMGWPVSGGRIINSFGENRNKVLNTVTINYGIDITTGPDKKVKAVAEGIVSAVEWIPGYGSVVIISHNEEYRTVYGHLSGILVDEGDLIKEGQAIASVGEDLGGSVLHFEIWNSRINQDPAVWLAGR